MNSTIDFQAAMTAHLRRLLDAPKDYARNPVTRHKRGGCSCEGCGGPGWYGEGCTFCGRAMPEAPVVGVSHPRAPNVGTHRATPLLSLLRDRRRACDAGHSYSALSTLAGT